MKTSNSQSIDTPYDLLAKYFRAYNPYDGEVEQTMQALYEAVVAALPKKFAVNETYGLAETGVRNGTIDETLTNLATLFGITKEGGSDDKH